MRIVLGRSVSLVSQRPRHSEVNQEYPTGLESNNQILAAPLDGGDGLALELGRDLLRLGRARGAWVEDVDALEAPADEHRLEVSADRLNLGQLGHGASLAVPFRGAST